MTAFLRKLNISDVLRKVILAWLVAALMEYLHLPESLRSLAVLDGIAQMSLTRLAANTTLGFVGLLLLSHFPISCVLERIAFPAVFAALAASALAASRTEAFSNLCVFVFGILLVYALLGWKKEKDANAPGKRDPMFFWLMVELAVVFAVFVSLWTVCRVNSFSTPTYDFGIFSQMFYNMKESGLPLTTVERDGLLSHFKVHVSPTYYLMLPFYMLVPTPATLQVLQAVVLASSVIPLWKIGKHHGLSGLSRMLLCGLLLLYPAFSGGTSYDIHENCFLTPLLLWLLYGIDKNSIPITAVSAVLMLGVKEDAAVYVAVVGLYLVLRTLLRYNKAQRKALFTGLALMAGSIAWFFAVTGYLANSGDGVMTYRYNNFIYDGSSSLLTVIKAVLLSPMKAIFECADKEKLLFIMQTLLPLLGLPFLTRRYERFVLLIPYVLINLMPDYRYQHDIFFQYTFGSTACLFYLAAVNLAEIRIKPARVVAAASAVAVSATLFCSLVIPKAAPYMELCRDYGSYYDSVRQTLDKIPADASVSATTFYTTYLSQRKILYDIRYADPDHVLETEYVVLKKNSPSEYSKYLSSRGTGYENLCALLEREGYEVFAELGNVLIIYKKSPA